MSRTAAESADPGPRDPGDERARPHDHDVIIVGAGTAGLTALREVRRQTDRFLVVNHGSWGTTCAEVGCMPSKALIEAANAFHRRTTFPAFGIRGGDALEVDIPAVLARVRRLRDGFTRGPKGVEGELGDRAISGRARLLTPDTLEVNGQVHRARRIILAVGSTPIVPGAWKEAFGDRILTTDTLFEAPDLPPRMAVVGLGAIGVEMAQALSRLGIEVAGFGANERVAGLRDPEVERSLREALAREFSIHAGEPARLRPRGDAIEVEGAGGRFTADAVLVAVGRRPLLEEVGLGALLASLEIPVGGEGLPEVNPRTLQVADLPLFLAGDANAWRPILHEAADEGHVAGRNALAETPAGYCRRVPLAITFTAPTSARVGDPLDALDPATTVIGAADFSRQSRARMAEAHGGRLRVYADRDDGRLQGAELFCHGAEHMAHLLALGLERKLTVHELLAMPFYHPVVEEGLRTALRDAARQVVDPARPTGTSDLADCPGPEPDPALG